METALISPAKAAIFGMPAVIIFILIPIIGLAFFGYVVFRRLIPLTHAAPAPDPSRDRIKDRIVNTFLYPHHKMPRYMLASVIHMSILSGFIILSLRWITMILLGISDGFVLPGFSGIVGVIYGILKDVSATVVLAACIFALIRRGIFTPERYAVPDRHGEDRTWETMLVLSLLVVLIASDMFFQGSLASAQIQRGLKAQITIPGTGVWFARSILGETPITALQNIHLRVYLLHDLVFFILLCLFPFGRFFHLVTSLPNLFSMKLDKGTIKPVRWGVEDDKLDELESFGVKKFEDFTWKHMLDFYSCADCGRCSDNCPANAVGRPLSPRFISIKGRHYAYEHYPVFGKTGNNEPLIGNIYSEDEIWSCTTCGACEEECPLMIQYIDKIVDLRRGMVDEGMVPQSLQKPLSALEKRGNPWGKMERKRAEWTKAEGFAEVCPVKILGKKASAETLYFVDSITSFDDRIQEIGRATARILTAAGIDFGILGPAERDSGHEVRRFGEEMLFQELRDRNSEAIFNSGAANIVTADPHTLNSLKNDYTDMPPVEHISQVIARNIKSGKIRLKRIEDESKIYTYHDPCYLGRHNGIYDEPREVIDAIAGIQRVEMMPRCRDRSFCCSGGGLMLFYEPDEEQRMGTIRVEMANEAGANVIVTACPFCMVNIEDAIKTSGLEGKMEAIDLVELIDRHIASD